MAIKYPYELKGALDPVDQENEEGCLSGVSLHVGFGRAGHDLKLTNSVYAQLCQIWTPKELFCSQVRRVMAPNVAKNLLKQHYARE